MRENTMTKIARLEEENSGLRATVQEYERGRVHEAEERKAIRALVSVREKETTMDAIARVVDDRAAMVDLMRNLRDIATGETRHVLLGGCPDTTYPHLRADGCPACDILRRADALLGGA